MRCRLWVFSVAVATLVSHAIAADPIGPYEKLLAASRVLEIKESPAYKLKTTAVPNASPVLVRLFYDEAGGRYEGFSTYKNEKFLPVTLPPASQTTRLAFEVVNNRIIEANSNKDRIREAIVRLGKLRNDIDKNRSIVLEESSRISLDKDNCDPEQGVADQRATQNRVCFKFEGAGLSLPENGVLRLMNDLGTDAWRRAAQQSKAWVINIEKENVQAVAAIAMDTLLSKPEHKEIYEEIVKQSAQLATATAKLDDLVEKAARQTAKDKAQLDINVNSAEKKVNALLEPIVTLLTKAMENDSSVFGEKMTEELLRRSVSLRGDALRGIALNVSTVRTVVELAVNEKQAAAVQQMKEYYKNATDARQHLGNLAIQAERTVADVEMRVKQISDLQKQVGDAAKFIQAGVAAATATRAGAQIGGVRELTLIQRGDWSALADKDKLGALTNGAFQQVILHRDRIVKSIEAVGSSENLANAISGGLGATNEIAALATAMGVDVPDDIRRGLDMANSGIAVFNAFATFTNPMSAFGAAAGLLGGGMPGLGGAAPDPAAAQRHAETMRSFAKINAKLEVIDKKLEKVIDLQKETLQRIEDLSAKLDDTRQELLAKLETMNRKLDFIGNLTEEISYRTAFKKCGEFITIGRLLYRMDERGQYLSYGHRRAHYENNAEVFKVCERFVQNLSTTFAVGALSGSGFATHGEISLILTTENREKNREGGFQESKWAPMVDLTRAYLGTGNGCEGRWLGVLSGIPEQLSQSENIAKRLKCLPGVEVDSDVYRSTAWPDVQGTLLHPEKTQAFNRHIYFDGVRAYGDLMTFLAPFYDLRAHDNAYRLKDEKELSVEGVLLNKSSQGVIWLSSFMDLLNLALAQEAVYAGVAIASPAASLLREKRFGNDAAVEGFGAAIAGAGEDGCPSGNVDIANRSWSTDEDTRYFSTVCAMKNNAAFRANVISEFVYVKLREKGFLGTGIYGRDVTNWGDTSQIRMILDEFDAIEMKRENECFGDGNEKVPGWCLRLKEFKSDGQKSDVYFALPPAYLVEMDRISYGPQTQNIRRYKELIARRLLMFGLTPNLMVEKGLVSSREEAEMDIRQMAMSPANLLGLELKK